MPDRTEDVIDQLHALMHLFKDRMRQALNVDGGGLGPTEARALRFFSHHPGSTQQDLVAHSGRDKAQITRIVQQLMERELLAREPDPNDGRRFNLQLTKKGLALQEAMHTQRKKLAADMLRDLSKDERQQLGGLLERMRESAEGSSTAASERIASR
ncbi:MarR family transcriptional regulator [Uliginosibacterium sp. H3]|uniref:MarR family transcriptional regulator n=1 Tax=Uliginosibacterium silvisoli TaxID=3114758 RepID=A0ABU6K0K7_9RHOO|nr:MarR family transcriptional regulator [Uliginosibacterium sp. H3]